MTKEVRRIYPEAKTALIHWIEENYHEIDEYFFLAVMKDGEQMNIYDFYSYRNAVGSIDCAKDSIHRMSEDGTFIPKDLPKEGINPCPKK